MTLRKCGYLRKCVRKRDLAGRIDQLAIAMLAGM